MSLRTLFRRSAVPMVAAVALSALAAVPAEAAPGKPTSLALSNTCSGLKVTWKKASGVKKYKVQWSTSSKFAGAKSTYATSTSRTLSSLAKSKKYYLRVRGENGKSIGSWSSSKSVTTWGVNGISGTTAPYSLTQSGSDITVKWKRPKAKYDCALKYQVTVADNRDMRSYDDAYKKQTVKRPVYFKQTTVTSTSDSPSKTFSAAPTSSTGIGAQYFVRVYTYDSSKSNGLWWDGKTAATRPAFGAKPASPSSNAITASAGCSSLVVRWADGMAPARSRGLNVEVSTVAPDPVTTTYEGYQPAESATISGLAEDTEYLVRAVPASVNQVGASWTDPVLVKTGSCDAPTVKVGTYNIVNNTAEPYNDGESWSKRKAAVANVIKGSGAGVVGLQEARKGKPAEPSDQQMTQLKQELGPDWVQADSAFAGVHTIFDSTKVAPVGTAQGLNHPGETFKEYAVAQAFTPLGGGATFIVLNVHATATFTDVERGEEVDDALSLIGSIKTANTLAEGTPVVVVGDFNLSLSEYRDTPVRAALGASLTDAKYWKPGRALLKVNSQNGFKKSGHLGELGIDVDGIFHSGTASPISWEMRLPNYSASTGKFSSSAVLPSDHNMLVAAFRFPTP